MLLKDFRPLPTLAPEGATGGSILSDAGAAAASAPPPPPPAPGTAAATLSEVVDGPPEWVPEKFWDKDKRQARYEDMGRGYKSLEQLLGREKVPLPASDDDKDGWERWYNAQGRPEKPDGYEFERPKELPEDLPYDEGMEKTFRDWAHQNGLSKKQARNAHDWFVKSQIDRNVSWHNMNKENRSNAEVALRRELGNKYEGWMASTGAVYQKYADPDFAGYLQQTGLGNDPRMIRMFGRIAQDMGGDTRLLGRSQPQAQPADLEKAIGKFRADNQKALMDRTHPENQRLSTELSKMYEALYPEPPR